MGGAGWRSLSLSRRKHPPLPGAEALRHDDRKGGAVARESAQSDRRHCGHAFGLADLMFQTLSDLRRLLRAARVLARYDALIPREYDTQLPASLKVARFFFGGRKADRESP